MNINQRRTEDTGLPQVYRDRANIARNGSEHPRLGEGIEALLVLYGYQAMWCLAYWRILKRGALIAGCFPSYASGVPASLDEWVEVVRVAEQSEPGRVQS